MKTSIKASLFAAFTLLLGACSTDKVTEEFADNGYTEEQGFAFNDLQGICEKGPFLKGSEVIMYELDSATFEKTGKTFETTVYDNRGRFKFPGDTIKYSVVLLEATGYYTDDVTGKKSKHKATLYALVNLAKTNSVYMNLLSIVEYSRIDHLMGTDSMSYNEAQRQASEEVQAAFSNDSVSEKLNNKSMFGSADENAYLFAINVMIQAIAEDGDVNSVLKELINDLKEDGILDSVDLQKMFEKQADSVNVESIRKNFEDLNVDTVPEFEKYLCSFAGDKAEQVKGCKDTSNSTSSDKDSLDSVKKDKDSQDSTKKEEDPVDSSSSSMDSVSTSSSNKGTLVTTDVDCSKYEKSNWDYLNPKINYSCILDGRDGQVYKTVVIGEQTWMAENLNYNPGYGGSESDPYGWSWCYDNDSKNCETYGRLYTKAAAMDSTNQGGFGKGSTIDLENNHRGACPAGWHVPTNTDISNFMDYIDDQDKNEGILNATKGWNNDANGSDALGFSALPGGYKNSEGFKSKGTGTVWRYHSTNTTSIYSIFGDNLSTDADKDGAYAYYIRCIKNNSSKVTTSSSSKEPEMSSSSSEENTPETTGSSNEENFPTTTEVDCSKYEKSNWEYLNPDIEYNCILDGRDGQVYKTVVIGEQTWMAENLNFNPGYGGPEYEPYVWSWCYDNDSKNCETYGRLYTKAAAMDSTNQGGFGYATAITLADDHRGACPIGWHVPTGKEAAKLLNYIEDMGHNDECLKSKKGWDNDDNGSDALGFSALPGGYKNKSEFKSIGTGTVWRVHSASATSIYSIFGDNLSSDADRDGAYGYYIRCIKNAQ